MSELEELERKKKELQLRQEIAELERKERMRSASNNFAQWNWMWVAPLTIFGAFLFIVGIGNGEPAPVIFGVLLLIPVGLKLFNGAGRKDAAQ